MIVRCKSGLFQAGNASVLLEYLGVKKDASGVLPVSDDVELIASVPISMSFEPKVREHLAESNECRASDIPDGISWTFSTFDLDRFGERVDPAGWDFKQYAK